MISSACGYDYLGHICGLEFRNRLRNGVCMIIIDLSKKKDLNNGTSVSRWIPQFFNTINSVTVLKCSHVCSVTVLTLKIPARCPPKPSLHATPLETLQWFFRRFFVINRGWERTRVDIHSTFYFRFLTGIV